MHSSSPASLSDLQVKVTDVKKITVKFLKAHMKMGDSLKY